MNFKPPNDLLKDSGNYVTESPIYPQSLNSINNNMLLNNHILKNINIQNLQSHNNVLPSTVKSTKINTNTKIKRSSKEDMQQPIANLNTPDKGGNKLKGKKNHPITNIKGANLFQNSKVVTNNNNNNNIIQQQTPILKPTPFKKDRDIFSKQSESKQFESLKKYNKNSAQTQLQNNYILTTNFTDNTSQKTDENRLNNIPSPEYVYPIEIANSIQNINNLLSHSRHDLYQQNISQGEDENRLLMKNNIIRRETFIDNNFNKKFTSINENAEAKGNIINELFTNSDLRIKKYGILFDFINTNIREITELMAEKSEEEEQISGEVKYEEKVESLTENKKININLPKILADISGSFLASSAAEEDFYQGLADFTLNYTNLNNFSNEMSTMRVDQSCIDKFDKTQCQYDEYPTRKNTCTQEMNNETCQIIDSEPNLFFKNNMYLDIINNFRNKINPQLILKHIEELNKAVPEKVIF
jgi:hypothetical protein